MGDEFTLGIYKYKCSITGNQLPHLPEQLKMSNISPCGVLLELVMCILDEECRNICNRFMLYDRTNNFVYERILNELTQYFVVNELSPCEGFVHLYRTLEFMSYSFPLIYASKSKSYRGTYDSLKKFLAGDSGGELKFFDKFLKEIFKTNFFTFDENTLTFKFKNEMELFIEIRNRYFHMLLGQGRNNFLNMEYDKNDLFRSLNPVFINWLVFIFVKIVQHGIESCN